MTPQPRDDRGTLTRITQAVYWFVVIDVLVVLTALPTAVTWMLLAPDASNIPLYALSALFVPPAVAAAFHSWRAWSDDPDPVPLRTFLRGYRINVLDSLTVAVPAVIVLTVLGTNITFGEAAGTGALTAVFVVMAGAVVLLTTRALSLTAAFSFRYRDLWRLAVFTALTMPLRTLSLLSLWVLMAGLSVLVGDYIFLMTASLLTFAIWRSERPVLERVRERFVAGGEQAGTPQ